MHVKEISKPSEKNRVLWTKLDSHVLEEIQATLDVYFDTMEVRWVQNEIELFNGARTYATKNFGNSDFVKDALKAHKQFNRLYQLPVIQQYLRQERLSKDKNRSPWHLAPTMHHTQQKILSSLNHSEERKNIITATSAALDWLKKSNSAWNLESQITAAFASGNLNEIHALLERENIEVISLSSRKFPNSSDLKKKSLLGHEISFDIAKQLADSYKMDAFVPISEIICLKDGDVVSFRKLGISPDGMDIKHFRIVKIEEVRLTNSDYEIRCIANCIYLVWNKAYELKEWRVKVRMPSAGLKAGDSLRVFGENWEFINVKIKGGMSVYTEDIGAFRNGIFKKARFLN